MNVTKVSQQLMQDMTPQEIENALRKAQAPRKVQKSHKKSTRDKGKKKDQTENSGAVNKSTRPVNSWVAFRSYYSTIFSSAQQKEISGFVTHMWQADPFKAKWTILAKAYSAIRDVQGKVNTPFNQFLAINTSLMGIIEPDQYLDALGWNFFIDDDGHVMANRDDPKIETDILSTNVSVNDVIQNCYMQGYFTGRLSDVLLTNDETTMTVVQGSPQVHDEDFVEEDTNQTSIQVDASVPEHQSITHEGNDTQDIEFIETHASTPSTLSDGLPEDLSLTTIELNQAEILNAPTEALFPADFKLPQSEYALDEAFDPLLFHEQAVFDPFAGNQFDAFDWMDGWDQYINFEACS